MTTEQVMETKGGKKLEWGDSFCYPTVYETVQITQKTKVASEFEIKMQIYVAIMKIKYSPGQMKAFSSSPLFSSMRKRTPNTPRHTVIQN